MIRQLQARQLSRLSLDHPDCRGGRWLTRRIGIDGGISNESHVVANLDLWKLFFAGYVGQVKPKFGSARIGRNETLILCP